jgi:hypothetical protein
MTTLNTAVFAPMPMASVRMATAARPGEARSVRIAYRTSCHTLSTTDSHPTSRTWSLIASTLPISTRAARVASARLRPSAIFC